MKRLLPLWLLIVIVMSGCVKRDCDFLCPIDSQDEEYTMLIDSLEPLISNFRYYHLEDTVLISVCNFYEEGNTQRHIWMQARCHYLLGCLQYDQNKMEQSAAHLIKALELLDTNFEGSQAPVGRLYSKTFFTTSRVAQLFANENGSKQFARFGLDCASAVGDTSWMLRSYANLGLLYERFGKAGEGDTAFL